MKKVFLHMISTLILLTSCTKIDFEEPVPAIGNGFSPLTIQTGLPVVEILTDPAEFDKMYKDFTAKIQVDARINYYGPDKTLWLEDEPSLIEIKGTSSASYIMKSLGITFNHPVNNTGRQLINPPHLLEGDHINTLQNIRLRNSGNDFGKTMIKDLAYTQLAIDAGLDLELMYGTPVHAFVNDRYYGLINLRTESNRIAIANLLEKDTAAVTLLKLDIDNGNLEHDEGNSQVALQLKKAVKNRDVARIRDLIDIDNFIDYLIYQDYIGNTDWPGNNARAYCTVDQPLRFFLFDLDYAAFRTKNPLIPELEYLDDDISKIFRVLNEGDQSFMPKLEARQKELYQILSPGRFNRIVDELAHRIENDIPYLTAKYREPASTMHWKLHLEDLKREFEKRDYYIRKKYDIN